MPSAYPLGYSIVLATRNRLKALELSIPRMLLQSRPPAQLILVDSSDDHPAIAAAVKRLVGNHSVSLTIKHTGRGLTLQRNAGLQLVDQPIVFFADDDSIWFPETAARQLAVYEMDTSASITAVCATESLTPPDNFVTGEAAGYSMRTEDRLKARVAGFRRRWEKRLFPDPARILGQGYCAAVTSPAWFAQHDVVPVDYMTGFRMSFRTEIVREFGFEERFTNYALFDDVDASFGAWKRGTVVAARQARVFHYRSPERRANGRRLGAQQLLAEAFIIAKHTEPGHPARRAMMRFARYKALLYLLNARDKFGLDRFRGATAAMKYLRGFIDVPVAQAGSLFTEAIAGFY
jgi:glycosyltransferase involved in cell wall biosynthesis